MLELEDVTDWCDGDRVRVIAGDFEGFAGSVDGRNGERVLVNLRLFDRSAVLEFDPSQLRRDEPGDGGGAGVREPRTPMPSGGTEQARAERDDG